MNSIDVKLEKANAVFRYQRLQNLTTLFRFMEALVLFIVISKFSFQLPIAIRVSTEHFRGISFTILTPGFVFVIGNVIILILLFKSRVADNGDHTGKNDVSDDHVNRCEKIVNTSRISTIVTADNVPSKKRKICRSQSENLMIVNSKNSITSYQKLRRSLTARNISKKIDGGGEETAGNEKSCEPDELSGEEFRRTVEAFIARQQKSLRDEEVTQVAYIGAESNIYSSSLETTKFHYR